MLKKDMIIPKNDPYYLEMKDQEKLKIQLRKRKKSQNIFNHPNLQFYHKEQAQNKKSQMEEDNYKQKLFLVHKWKILKQIKAEQISKNQAIQRHKQKVKNLILFVKILQMVHHIDKKFKRNKHKYNVRIKSQFVSAIMFFKLTIKLRSKGFNIQMRQKRQIRK